MTLLPLLYQMPQVTHHQHIFILDLHLIERRLELARAISTKRQPVCASASLRTRTFCVWVNPQFVSKRISPNTYYEENNMTTARSKRCASLPGWHQVFPW